MTILVLGSSGQLATHLRELLPDARYCGRDALDLCEPARVTGAIEAMKPSVIINAAGYTAVDTAESEPAVAWRINAESVAATARAAAALDVHRHVEGLTARHAHELALRVLFLGVQTSQHPTSRSRVVILHER